MKRPVLMAGFPALQQGMQAALKQLQPAAALEDVYTWPQDQDAFLKAAAKSDCLLVCSFLAQDPAFLEAAVQAQNTGCPVLQCSSVNLPVLIRLVTMRYEVDTPQELLHSLEGALPCEMTFSLSAAGGSEQSKGQTETD